LFVVFYTLACRWGRCLGCNLPARSSPVHVDYRSLLKQIDRVFGSPDVVARRQDIHKVILSNNGSILDEATFSSTALLYFLAQLNLNFPRLSALSIETRPEYVDLAELEFIARALAEGDTPTRLELAIGFEAFDDGIRNHLFQKGLDKKKFERLVEDAARYAFHIKCYFMQKPVPGLSDEDAVIDIYRAVDYLADLATREHARLNLHLNPTFAARGTPLETAFRNGEFRPPRLTDVARAALHAAGKPLSVFIGLSDEGLAVQGGSFLLPGEERLVAQLETFNRTQNFAILEKIVAGAGPE
jgi:radical SAM enzyme (TIGR01210 family)